MIGMQIDSKILIKDKDKDKLMKMMKKMKDNKVYIKNL